MRAPLWDLRRHDAHDLCRDFTAGVDARLAPGGGSCATRTAQTFRLSHAVDVHTPIGLTTRPARMEVDAISWHGDRATATSFYAGSRASVRHWRLRRIDHNWRIATPARLQLRADCRHSTPGARDCGYAVWMRFAGTASG